MPNAILDTVAVLCE